MVWHGNQVDDKHAVVDRELVLMSNPSGHSSDEGHLWRTVTPVALIVTLATVGELALFPAPLFMVAHLAAAGMATRLPRSICLPVLVVLAALVTVPGLVHPDEANWAARSVAIFAMIVLALATSPSADPPRDQTHPEPEHPIESESPSSWDSGSGSGISHQDDDFEVRQPFDDDEPSTVIRREQDDFVVCDLSRDLTGIAKEDVVGIISHFRATGRFDEKQISLIESELKFFAANQITCDAPGFSVGDRVGRFVIDGPLGRGGVGNVYRGHDEKNGEPAAIKILHNTRVSDRFRREMQLVQQLAHPNIVTAYEVGEYASVPFISMELLRGPDLNVRVRDKGPLNWSDSTRYILQVARALEHAHRRDLIHRDIKPGNIILHGDEHVKLADLGLAAITPDALGRNMSGLEDIPGSIQPNLQPMHQTQEGHLAGTLAYMAPEQARSLAKADIRSDIYSLGATWFYLLTGQTRLRGETFSQQFENLLVRKSFRSLPHECLPDSLRRIYRRLIAYDQNERYKNCGEVAAALEHALDIAGESVSKEHINVLVVEDSHTDMLLTIEMLRRTNQSLTIHRAKSLAEGILAHRTTKMDLVLLDLTLPDSSGVATVRSFHVAAPGVPIVVLTGLSEDEASEDCLKAGASNFVSKSGLSAHKMERTIFVTLSRFAS